MCLVWLAGGKDWLVVSVPGLWLGGGKDWLVVGVPGLWLAGGKDWLRVSVPGLWPVAVRLGRWSGLAGSDSD